MPGSVLSTTSLWVSLPVLRTENATVPRGVLTGTGTTLNSFSVTLTTVLVAAPQAAETPTATTQHARDPNDTLAHRFLTPLLSE